MGGDDMGLRNLRAICPACGGKIHTQPKGLGHITWANSWVLVQTGSECQWCGARLTGKVKADGRAELAPATPSAAPKRHVVVTPDGEAKVFTKYTEAAVYKAVHGGELTSV